MRVASEAPSPDLFRVSGHQPEAVYAYHDDAGEIVAIKARFAPGTLKHNKKDFRLFRPQGDAWVQGLDGHKLGLYGQHLVREAKTRNQTVFLPEGEKCADLLRTLGLCATTSAYGAGKWSTECTEALRGADVVLFPDNDEEGHKHMLLAAEALYGVASRLRLVKLPGLCDAEDIVEWLEKGGSKEKLMALVASTPDWSPRAWTSSGEGEPMALGVSTQADAYPLKDGLPTLVRDLAEEIAAGVKVDPAAPAVIAQSVLSAAAGNAFGIRVSAAYVEPNLARNGIWVAQSGERKSATFRRVVSPLDAWMREMVSEASKLLADAQAEAAFYRKRAEHAETKGAKAKDASEAGDWLNKAREARQKIPALPRRPISYIGDTTPEALVRHMAENGGASAILAADARHVVDALLGRHRQDGQTDDSVYLRAHAGDRLDRVRVGNTPGGEFVAVDHPSLAVGICVQPDKFQQLAARPELIDSGLLPRCNLLEPRSLVGERIETGAEQPLDIHLEREWERCVRSILDYRFQLIDNAQTGNFEPIVLVLGPEAMELRRDFANEIEARQGAEGDLRGASAFASKAAGEAARLAGLWHLLQLVRAGQLDRAANTLVSAETWMQAELAQRWHFAESLRLLSLSVESSATKLGRRILEWAAAKPGDRRVISGRDLVAARIVESVADAEAALLWLEERLWVRPAQQGKNQRARRWDVHLAALRGDRQ